jgi:aminomuconate-semialdehyde/2-hydroxymuconate-6-semialdehyde dehydrogenase
VELAVAAAEQAFAGWSRTPAAERSRILLRIADFIERDLEKLALAESMDTGKPLSLARGLDIPRAASNFRFFATAILHTESEAHITDGLALNYTLRLPLGVVGLISPWNLPLYLLTWKIAPALACGNTAVAKPSELTPMSASLLCEICREAGLPAGVLNIAQGTGQNVGSAITSHPKVAAVSFTGGTVTGRKVAEACAPRFKKVSLELGGKNPNIIFADADLKAAIATSVRSHLQTKGRSASAVRESLWSAPPTPEFLEGFVAAVSRLKLGDPLDTTTDQGAIVSKTQLEKVKFYVSWRNRKAASWCLAAPHPRSSMTAAGRLFLPADSHRRPASQLPRKPRRNLRPGRDGHAVRQRGRSRRVGKRLRLRPRLERLDAESQPRPPSRGANPHRHRLDQLLDAARLRVPFGGMKQSGVGREGGNEALRFFTEPKNICIAK